MIGRPEADPRTGRPGNGVCLGKRHPAFFSEAPMLASDYASKLEAGPTREANMTAHGSWVSYSGGDEILLILVLVAAAAAVAYAGIRLPLPARLPRPGRKAKIMMVATWLLAIAALLACASIYIMQTIRAGVAQPPDPDPITPFTLIGVGILFFVIALAQNAAGWRVALGSAAVGAAAALVIFELPFDLIVMVRTHPVIDPGMYRVLLFGTLILADVTTLALLSLSPAVRLRRATLWCFAGMLAFFAVWGLFGFGYPSAPGPFTMNVLSKILALVTGLTLFLPERAQPGTPEPAEAPATSNEWVGVM
jgi:hypothetical protein